jgi:hypothetical protein
MNRDRLVQSLPNIITFGGVAAGAAGFADSYFSLYRGVDLGIRNFLPEPFDIPDHGMSWAMGAALSQVHFRSPLAKSFPSEAANALDDTASTKDRHSSIFELRVKIAGAVAGAIAAGSFYIVIGEVGSEVLHAVHRNRQADLPAEEKTDLPLGHLDPLDLIFGIGAAVSVAKLNGRNLGAFVDGIEATLPPLKKGAKPSPTQRPQPIRQLPAENKRYTRPKRHK